MQIEKRKFIKTDKVKRYHSMEQVKNNCHTFDLLQAFSEENGK